MADEFADKLSSVLNNPQAMSQIMSIAQSLTGETTSVSPDSVNDTVPAQPSTESAPTPVDTSALMGVLGSLTGGNSNDSLLSGLSDLDPKLIQTGLKLFSQLNTTDDRKTSLLFALAPFVKEERFAKMDRAIQIAKLSRMIRIGLQVFKEYNGGDSSHV